MDHVKDYRLPKEFGDEDEITKQIRTEGCGPQEEKEVKTEALKQKTEKGKSKSCIEFSETICFNLFLIVSCI